MWPIGDQHDLFLEIKHLLRKMHWKCLKKVFIFRRRTILTVSATGRISIRRKERTTTQNKFIGKKIEEERGRDEVTTMRLVDRVHRL